jgi:hypothetical protein
MKSKRNSYNEGADFIVRVCVRMMIHFFLARPQNYGMQLLASSCLPYRMEKLGSHWMDFYEILIFVDFS